MKAHLDIFLPLLAVVGLFVLAQILPTAQLRQLTEFLIFLALALNWNLLAGYAGLISVGQQAFVGIGAYAVYTGTALMGWPILASVGLSAGVTALFALIVFPVLFRLRGPQFAIGSWVLAEMCLLAVANTEKLGAGTGIGLPIKVARDMGASRSEREMFIFLVVLGLVALTFIGSVLFLRSRSGFGLIAMRDDEGAAESVGVSPVPLKLGVYVATAAITGAIGAAVLLFKLRVTPGSAFSLIDWTAFVIFIVIIGGQGRLWGPVLGAVMFFGIRNALADFGALYLILLGVIAVVIMVASPGGLSGLIEIMISKRRAPQRERDI
jgi:branched-chain amino acid transport system permease protein